MTPDSLLNMNGDLLAAIDIETTGRLPGYHEIVQIAVVPANSQIQVSQDFKPFYIHLAPNYPSRAEAKAMQVNGLDLDWLSSHGVDQDRGVDLFTEWFLNLDLPFRKRLLPLACNWSFEKMHLTAWQGLDEFDTIWHPHVRDIQRVATMLNDASGFHGFNIPFTSVSLKSLCKKFGIINSREHDAMADSIASIEVYRELIVGMA